MSEEAVHIMRRLWRENDVAYDGAFTRFEHVTIEPKPAQPGGVPIWLASNDVDAGLRRVGRMGDAWMNNIKEPGDVPYLLGRRFAPTRPTRAEIPTASNRPAISLWPPAAETRSSKDKTFSPSYYNRSYDAIVKAMLCVTGSWDEVIDRLEALSPSRRSHCRAALCRRDQLRHLENCADAFKRRGLMD